MTNKFELPLPTAPAGKSAIAEGVRTMGKNAVRPGGARVWASKGVAHDLQAGTTIVARQTAIIAPGAPAPGQFEDDHQ